MSQMTEHPTYWTVHHGMATFTETEFEWHTEFEDIPGPLRQDLLAWLEFHGVNSAAVYYTSRITRDLVRRAVVVSQYLVLNPEGKVRWDPEAKTAVIEKRVFQGETEPLPWPFTIEVLTSEQCLSHGCGRESTGSSDRSD